MLHHVSLTADDPRRVAEVLAELIGGRVTPFGPVPGAFLAGAADSAGTAIEVYPHGTELGPGEGEQPAVFQHNYFAPKQSGTHAALSVQSTAGEVFAIAAQQGWRALTASRGSFNVIEFWVENQILLEVLTPPMAQQYLAAVRGPHIPATSDAFRTMALDVRVSTEPATVFRAWTEPSALTDWWPMPAPRIDLRIGGRYELPFDAGASGSGVSRGTGGTGEIETPAAVGSQRCTVLSYLPDQMLSFTWNAPGRLGLSGSQTWVIIQLVDLGGSTAVSLTQCGFLQGELWDRAREDSEYFWRRILRRLVAHWDQPVDLRARRS